MKITHFHPQFPAQDGILGNGAQAETIYHNYYLDGERIRPMELENIGYRLTGRHVVIGNKYKLFELLPINSSFRASHSFLAPNHRVSGVIIPRTFNEHKAEINPLSAQARYTAIIKKKSRMGGGTVKDSPAEEQMRAFQSPPSQLFDKAV